MIGVDFGGTRIKIGRVRDAEILASQTIDTSAGAPPAAILDAIAAGVREIDAAPNSVGLAIPGEVDAGGRCWRLPNVPGFEGVELQRELEERLGCPVAVENDGTVAALGESLWGHGRRYRSFLMVTLGTGVGGGLVLDGRVRRGAHGFAAEIGHVFVDRADDAWQDAAGCRGSIEAYAGTRALLRRHHELGGTASEILDVAESARRGEPAGVEAFHMMAEALGIGLCSIQHVLDLDAIVFAGGISLSFDLIEPGLRAVLRERAYAPPLAEVPLLVSELGDRAGVVGAAHLPAALAAG